MLASLEKKLAELIKRHKELSQLLSSPEMIEDQNRFRDLSKEYAKLEPIVAEFQRYQEMQQTMTDAQALQQEDDPELQALATTELEQAQAAAINAEKALQVLLLPQDPNDKRNLFLEIRAGTGGDEAALFAGDLFRMYSRYAEQQRWQLEIINASEGEHGGYKEIIIKLIGRGAYSKLKFESGAHRVQRVPTTESQGRIHTSACTVAVLPEADEIAEIEIDMNDVRVDTFRASGAGGQHVNKTDSAIRLTHAPSGIVVECQDERSQHKNRARAMSLLKAKLLATKINEQKSKEAATRRNLVGSGDRSERIRTYNYPQGRVTDHRINLTLYKLTDIMEGALAPIIDPLTREHQADLLANLAHD